MQASVGLAIVICEKQPEKVPQKSFFNFAENCGTSSLCGQAVITTRDFCKRQKYYGFRAIRGWVTILADFQKRGIYKVIGFEAKLTFAVFFPINKRSPNFHFFTRLQGCKPLPLGKSSKKNENVSKEKKAKNPQNLSFFQKNDLNFAISKFSKFF